MSRATEKKSELGGYIKPKPLQHFKIDPVLMRLFINRIFVELSSTVPAPGSMKNILGTE